MKKILFLCGIISSVLYVAMNVIVAMLYPGYSSSSQTVSELSAIGAPTRALWVALGAVYTLLVAAFGWGIWSSAGVNRTLKVSGMLIFVYGIIGIGWPFAPMHQREILAAGGETISDTMHIVFTVATVIVMVCAMGFGSVSFGKKFRNYSFITISALIVFGSLTALDAGKVEANLPTPLIGIWERINIGVFLLWIVVLSITLLQKFDYANK